MNDHEQWRRLTEVARVIPRRFEIESSAVLKILSEWAEHGIIETRAKSRAVPSGPLTRNVRLSRDDWLFARTHGGFDLNSGTLHSRTSGSHAAMFRGIEFRVDQLDELLRDLNLPQRIGSEPEGMIAVDPDSKETSKRGRRRSSKWDGFIAELCAYIHYEGIPDGEGVRGIEEVIEQVSSRLGYSNLSRTSVQSAVRATLLRLREGSPPR